MKNKHKMAIKENIKKREKPLKDNKKEDDMAKQRKNLTLLVLGWIFLIIGIAVFILGLLKISLFLGKIQIGLISFGLFVLVAGIVSLVVYSLTK